MSQILSKNQHILHQPPAQKPFSVEDVGRGVDQRLARSARILASHTNATACLDRRRRVTYLNPQAESLLQKTREELLGRILWEACPEVISSTVYCKYHEAFEAHPSVHFEAFYPPFNKRFEVRAHRSKNSITVSFVRYYPVQTSRGGAFHIGSDCGIVRGHYFQ